MSEWIVNAEIDNEYAITNGYQRLVRCKDCKYIETRELNVTNWSGVLEKRNIMFCKYGTPTLLVTDFHFCSYGERKANV